MKKVVAIQGCSGSGKSTLAENIKASYELDLYTCNIFTTDDFFMVGNKYNFDATLLSLAHSWNQARVARSMMLGHNVIIVPNTNTTTWEVKAYYKLANKFDYDFSIIEPKTSWRYDAEELFKRNVHGVPLEVIKNQLSRREDPKVIMENLLNESDN